MTEIQHLALRRLKNKWRGKPEFVLEVAKLKKLFEPTPVEASWDKFKQENPPKTLEIKQAVSRYDD